MPFVYALVPRSSLEETVKTQARLVAAERLKRVAHTMLLEAQGLSAEEHRPLWLTQLRSWCARPPRISGT